MLVTPYFCMHVHYCFYVIEFNASWKNRLCAFLLSTPTKFVLTRLFTPVRTYIMIATLPSPSDMLPSTSQGPFLPGAAHDEPLPTTLPSLSHPAVDDMDHHLRCPSLLSRDRPCRGSQILPYYMATLISPRRLETFVPWGLPHFGVCSQHQCHLPWGSQRPYPLSLGGSPNSFHVQNISSYWFRCFVLSFYLVSCLVAFVKIQKGMYSIF